MFTSALQHKYSYEPKKMASPPPHLRAVLCRKVESTMLTLVGLRFIIEDGHPGKASDSSIYSSVPRHPHNATAPPLSSAWFATNCVLLMIIELPCVHWESFQLPTAATPPPLPVAFPSSKRVLLIVIVMFVQMYMLETNIKAICSPLCAALL